MLQQKQLVAKKAVTYIKDGMKIGLGTGSTANELIKILAYKIKEGLNIKAVATSKQTEALCKSLNIELCTLDELKFIDLTIDGADEINGNLEAIKGGGGALLCEKIVAQASENLLVIADESKLVDKLGAYPLPIEIVKFGASSTKKQIEDLFLSFGYQQILANWRLDQLGKKYITDEGNYILDVDFGAINDVQKVASALEGMAGVVEHGLFYKEVTQALIATKSGDIKTI